MNGYGSQRSAAAVRFSAIQVSTTRLCQNRNLPVPRKRASRSEKRANASASTARRGSPRGPRGWSSRRRETGSGIGVLLTGIIESGVLLTGVIESGVETVGLPPPHRQQVVEDVVHGDRAEQVV